MKPRSKLILCFLFFYLFLDASHLFSEEIPNGLDSYLNRPSILNSKATEIPNLEPIWNKLKPVLPDTIALLTESYPEHDIYFLARDGELLYDYAVAAFQENPEYLKRLHLLNVSRANMDAPHLLDYLKQEGIDLTKLNSGKKFLFVDTGFSGTISKKLESIFPAKFKSQLNTHLLLSETQLYPSTRVFLNGLSPWANYLSAEEIHGKIVALEHLPHYTDRSNQYAKIDNRWHPLSQKSASTNLNISPTESLRYQQDLLYFARSTENIQRLKSQKNIWKKIYKLHKDGEKEKLITFFKELKSTHPNNLEADAIARDYLDMAAGNIKGSKTALITAKELGLAVQDNGKTTERIKADFPEYKAVLENPSKRVPEMLKNNEHKKLAELSEVGIVNNDFRNILIKNIREMPFTAANLKFLNEVVEFANRDILEDLPKTVFSKKEFANAPGGEKIIARFLHLAEEDAIDELLNHFVSKAHFSNLKNAPEILRMIIEHGDEENLKLLSKLMSSKDHLKGDRFSEAIKALKITNPEQLLSYTNTAAESTLNAKKVKKNATNSEKSIKFSLPDLSTDEKKLQWLLQTQQNIPGLFDQAAKYDIDLMKLLEDQDRLQKILLENPNYLNAIKAQHPDWISISITPKHNQVIKSLKINPKAIESWKNSLSITLSSLNQKKPIEKELIDAIFHESSFINKRSTAGIETGLGMSLNPEDKKLFFKASPEEKLRLLKEKLPSPLDDSFKAALYGLPKNPNKEDVLNLLDKLYESEKKLRELAELHLVLQDANGKINSEASSRLAQLEVSDLEFFTDIDTIQARVKILDNQLMTQYQRSLSKNIFSSMEKHVKKFSSQVEMTEEALGNGIKLVEMPPAMGIFRGCTGGDCSTQYSFPYPNSPNERVFYIYDGNKEIKGFATGTLLANANGKKSFQVITIAGPRISSADTEMILKGFNHIKKDLNAESIILPVKENITRLINFLPIRTVYEKYTDGQTPVKINYLDKEDRKKIEKFKSTYNHAEYDKMSQNTEGVEYKPKDDLQLSFEMTKHVQDIKPFSKTDTKKSTFEFVIRLISSNRDSQIPRILKAAGFSKDEIDEIKILVNNDQKLNILDYQNKIKKLFGYSDLEINERMILFTNGYLNSPDLVDMPKILNPIIEKADQDALLKLAKLMFSQSHKNNIQDLIKILIEKTDSNRLTYIASQVFSLPETKEMTNLLKILIEKGEQGTFQQLITSVFSKYHTENDQVLLKMIIDKADQETLQMMAEFLFSKPHSQDMQDLLKMVIDKSDSNTLAYLIRFSFSQPHTKNMQKELATLVLKLDYSSLSYLTKDKWFKNTDSPYTASVYAKISKSLNITDPIKKKLFLEQQDLAQVPKNQAGVIEELKPRTEKIAGVPPREISHNLSVEDIVRTRNGKTLTVISFVDEGKRGRVYLVKDTEGNRFALKVAKDSAPETLASMKKESTKSQTYEKYKIPHAKIFEAQPTYALKEWVEGTRADDWIKDWKAKGNPENTPELKSLRDMIESISKQGVYVGDLNPKNLIWNGEKWIIIDSGGISEDLGVKESLEKFLDKIPSRWSKNSRGNQCPLMFKKLVKAITP